MSISLSTGNTDDKPLVALGRIATIVEKGRKRIMNIYRHWCQRPTVLAKVKILSFVFFY